MELTSHLTFVLTNLNRVMPLVSRSPFPRYQLDGHECTAQITGLVARKLIVINSDGRLKRVGAVGSNRRFPLEKGRAGTRQAPLIETRDLLKAIFLIPVSVHKDPDSASARASARVERTSSKQRPSAAPTASSTSSVSKALP